MYQQQSYDQHINWYNQLFPTRESKVNYYLKVRLSHDTIAHWLQMLFFKCLDPLLKEPLQNWLTVGDAYGFDAQYILKTGNNALATDLNTHFLEIAKEENIIQEYDAQNAEHLSFSNNRFDYVLCKESYHHFPRPYAALYEMIRVAKKGIVIIEPQDPVLKMPGLLWLSNILASQSGLMNKIWKNRFSYEPVGNFVYKLSVRELEKFAAGLNLPLIAFKAINPHFYSKKLDGISSKSRIFFLIKTKKLFLDILLQLGVIPGQVLSTVIFKQMPDELTVRHLRADGYRLIHIPKNPYIK